MDRRQIDQRYQEYARLMLSRSLQLQPGEKVLIDVQPNSAALAEVVGQEVVRAGGHPLFWFTAPQVGISRLIEGIGEQLDFIHSAELSYGDCDCHVIVEAPEWPGSPHLEPARLLRRRLAMAKVHDRLRHQRTVLALQPTHFLAQCLGQTFKECEDLVFRATVGMDWDLLTRRAGQLQDKLHQASEVRIVAEGTDLKFSIAGRRSKVCSGRRNLPGGEVFLSPIEDSADGHVSFIDTQYTSAGTIRGLQLRFSQGEVAAYSASQGAELLEAMMAVDSGARRLGEFGAGLSPVADRITGVTLFDEKLAGTVHLALGRGFPEIGGTNQSDIHWDMILDLRRGGYVLLDGHVVCRNGEWLLPGADLLSAV